jgi:SnoaL-like domain
MSRSPACIWPVLVGREAVLESWRRILGNPGAERIEFHDAAAMVAGSEGRVLCIEVIGGMAFAASNWFRRIDGTWRMIHHHASPIAPKADDDIPEPGRGGQLVALRNSYFVIQPIGEGQMKAPFSAIFMTAALLASVVGASATPYLQSSSTDDQLQRIPSPRS